MGEHIGWWQTGRRGGGRPHADLAQETSSGKRRLDDDDDTRSGPSDHASDNGDSSRSGHPGHVHDGDNDTRLGRPGRPLDRSHPLVIGFLGTIGVAMAYAVVSTIASIRSTLVLIGLALFIAIGLEPMVAFLTRKRFPRWLAVICVVLGAGAVVAGFAASAVSPISHEINQVSKEWPKWRSDLQHGRGTLGHLAARFHLTGYFSPKGQKKLSSTLTSGAIGAGKQILSAVSATVIVVVLTIYFLASLPSVKGFAVRLTPASRRTRISMLVDEILAGVGRYVLGNLFTSLVAGVGTLVWLEIFGVPYPLLLALVVAVFDLIPVVGSTVAGVIVSLVALTVSLPVAIATAVYYTLYRFLEDYLLVPKVMRHAVNVKPIVTVVATLIGAAVLGIIGALIAIPIAAAIQLLLQESAFPHLDRA